jgi:hypothetical protein
MPRPEPPTTQPRSLRSWFSRKRNTGSEGPVTSEDPLLQAGRLLRQRREERGLSLRQLALETRISTPVLEAIERGWRDRLPESTYLRTMLPLIEQHLALPEGSLQAALPPVVEEEGPRRNRTVLLGRFTPGSIDVFTTWPGTVLYGLLTVGLIYALNLQQQHLAAAQLLTLRPISPLPLKEQARPVDPGALLLQIQPDLLPLQQAERGVGRQAFLQQRSQGEASPGVLRLLLAEPSRVLLKSASGERSDLSGARGEVVVQLLPPLEVEISPAPKAPAVFWDGRALEPLPKQPGHFRYPSSVSAVGLPRPAAAAKASNP